MLIKWIVAGAVATGASATFATAWETTPTQADERSDLTNVTTLLEAMRGTGVVPCAFAMGVVDGRNGWGRGDQEPEVGGDPTVTELRRWLAQGIKDPAVVAPLRAAMAPGDPCVRQTAVRLLGRTEHPQAIAALTAALQDTDVTTRELAAFGLGLTDSRAAYEPLVAALRDPEPVVRTSAALALGHLGDHRATNVLVPLLASDRIPTVRRAVAYALGHLD